MILKNKRERNRVKVSSNKRKTLDSKTGQSFVLEDKSMRGKQQNTTKKKPVSMSRQERDETLEKLENEILDAQYDITEYIKDHNKWSSNPTIIRNQTDVATYLYCKKLDIACMEPLARGIDRQSIAQSIGMSIGMRLASKDYREYKKVERAEKKAEKAERKYEKNQQGIKGKIRSQGAKTLDSAVTKLEELGKDNEFLNDVTTGLRKMAEMKSSKLKGEHLQEKAQKYRQKANGGVMPITQEGAAMTYIGLAKSAYQDMREPGADVDAIYENFIKARDCLYEQAKYEGISPELVNKQVREVVGKLAENHPEMEVFEEMSKGEVELQNGKFMNTRDGEEYVGAFKPRKPKTIEEYKEIIHNAYADMYSTCDNVKEINELNYEKTGFTKKMDRLRTQFCSDLGKNQEDVTDLNVQFNKIYSSAAVVKLHDWAKNSEQRQNEIDALFKHIQQEYGPKEEEQTVKYTNHTPASEMVSQELLEAAGMNNYDDMSYDMER